MCRTAIDNNQASEAALREHSRGSRIGQQLVLSHNGRRGLDSAGLDRQGCHRIEFRRWLSSVVPSLRAQGEVFVEWRQRLETNSESVCSPSPSPSRCKVRLARLRVGMLTLAEAGRRVRSARPRVSMPILAESVQMQRLTRPKVGILALAEFVETQSQAGEAHSRYPRAEYGILVDRYQPSLGLADVTLLDLCARARVGVRRMAPVHPNQLSICSTGSS